MLTDKELLVLELFNLEEADVEEIHYNNFKGTAQVTVKLIRHDEPCPHCGCLKPPKIKSYEKKRIIHSVLSDRKCEIIYLARRYKCPDCERTYLEHNPFVFKSMRISAKTVYNVLDDLKNHTETFSSAARRHHISPTTAASIFDQHVNMDRYKLPEILNIDEVYAFKSKYSKYVCVLTDFNTQEPVDLLNSRRKKHLERYFKSIPPDERNKVRFVCSDMYDVYRQISRELLPNSLHIVDHFHLQKELIKQADQVRIRVMKGTKRGTDQYHLLKHFSWMLYKNPNAMTRKKKKLFDPNGPRKENKHFKRALNYYELREMLMNISPQFLTMWNLKDSITDFFENSTRETAAQDLELLIRQFKESNIPEMIHFASTMRRWNREIRNFFEFEDIRFKVDKQTGHVSSEKIRITNSIIERLNLTIKVIKYSANGYSAWHRFRNRVLYVLRKTATYSLYPVYSKDSDKSD